MLFCLCYVLFFILVCVVLVLGFFWVLLFNGWWWLLLVSLVGLLLVYLIWSWCWLNVVFVYFGWELVCFDCEFKVLFEWVSFLCVGNDLLQNCIVVLEQVVSCICDSWWFMVDGLEGLLVVILICDLQGQILLVNCKVCDLFGGELCGVELCQCLVEFGYLSFVGGVCLMLEILEVIEFCDYWECDLCFDLVCLLLVESEIVIGWLVSLIDLSVECDVECQCVIFLCFFFYDLCVLYLVIFVLFDVCFVEDEVGQQVY